MNDKGISFVETLLSVVIIMILTSSLIPFSTKLHESLFERKLALHVSQVAYNAAKQIVEIGTTSGFEIIDNLDYEWTFDGQKLCVTYQLFKEVELYCISQEGVI